MAENTKAPIYRKLNDGTLERIDPQTVTGAVNSGSDTLDVVLDDIRASIKALDALSTPLTGLSIPSVPTLVTEDSTVLEAFGELQSQSNALGRGKVLTVPADGTGIKWGANGEDYQLRYYNPRFRIGTKQQVEAADGEVKSNAPWFSPQLVAENLPSNNILTANTTYRLAGSGPYNVILNKSGWLTGETAIIRTAGIVTVNFNPASGNYVKKQKGYADAGPNKANDITIYCILYTGHEFCINRSVYE